MNIAIIGDSWAARNKVAYKHLKKRNFTNIFDFSVLGASNIQSIQKAVKFLEDKNTNFKFDWTIWFQTCFGRDNHFHNDGLWYDLNVSFTPNEIYEKISHKVYKEYQEYCKISNTKTILIGGLGGVYNTFTDYFKAEMLIENWTNKIFNIDLPPLHGHTYDLNINLLEHKNNSMSMPEQYHYMGIYKILYDNWDNHPAFSVDKKHPNYETYELLFDEIKSFIDEHSVL
jgi:hypothetical protein